MHNDLLASIALVFFLGIASQLVAWRFQFPSILLLLGIGLVAGPGLGIVDVNHVFGELLFPLVSISVAIILFEGGLSLRLSDLRDVGWVVINLIIIGVPVTWLLSAGAAYYFLNMGLELSLLLGAVLVVTGPTVIIPLLKQIRPTARIGSILRWEGIVIDPVGAILAVLVFEEILATSAGEGLAIFITTLLETILIGFAGGWVIAQLMIVLFSRYIIPYPLQNPATLMFVIVAFTVSNLLEPESGLVTVTMMGFVMANQNRVDTRHIVEFKENLQVMLISLLFVLLAARLQPETLAMLDWRTLLFVAVIIFIARPLSAVLATLGSGLSWRERVFIGWMAPRGIVAAAVSSIFAAELMAEGFEDANQIVAYTFAVIISTVAVYSLTSGWLAQSMNLAEHSPQGILMLGGQAWARQVGLAVKDLGFRVVMADSNLRNILDAQSEGLETYYGNILSDVVLDDLDLGGIGRLLAMTPNHEVNSLASLHFQAVFGKTEVYQLVSDTPDGEIARNLSGRQLFSPNVTYNYVNDCYTDPSCVQIIDVSDPATLQARITQDLIPLFVVSNNQQQLHVWTADVPPALTVGSKLIALQTS